MFENFDTYVSPFLPESAKEKISEWQAKGKLVFQKVVPQQKEPDCKNCQDMAYVYVSFARAGPFKYPVHTSSPWAMLWFDGGPGVGKGWFIVRTQSYTCPACSGRPHDTLELEDDAKVEEPWWKD